MTWTSEEHPRDKQTILSIMKDGEIRGSIRLINEEEAAMWAQVIKEINNGEKK